MAESPDVMTAAELDALSPSERSQAIRTGLAADLDGLPDAFRQGVEETARRLSADLSQTTAE